MKNKNILAAVVRDPTARVTRAQAAASQSSEGMNNLDASKQHLQKRNNSKRVALDEKNSCAPTNQHKRRAVLKDVTNICCDNSYRNCVNATKLTVLDSSSYFCTYCSYMRSETVPHFFVLFFCLV